MTDNESLRPEDFEPHRVEPDRKPVKAGFKDVLREQPVIRVAVLLLPVIAVVVLILGVFGGHKQAGQVSVVGPGSQTQSSGVGKETPAYAKAQQEENDRRLKEAQENGTSNIPTQAATVSAINEPKKDVLADFVPPPVNTAPILPTPQPAPLAQQPFPQMAAPVQAPPPKLDPAQIQALAAEMRTIMGTTQAHTTIIQSHNPAAPTVQQAAATSAPSQPAPPGKLLVMAGTVLYGQTITEADSDIPAPILVSMLSGPFSGGRAIGTFQKTDDYLILAFGTIIKDKKEYHVNALAIDPDTTLDGLETDIDHHYFERFVLPAAAGFISGVGNYAQQAGSTVTSATYGVTQSYPPLSTHQEILAGLGQSANALSSAVQRESNVQPTIYVASGTGIGIMFINTVREAAAE